MNILSEASLLNTISSLQCIKRNKTKQQGYYFSYFFDLVLTYFSSKQLTVSLYFLFLIVSHNFITQEFVVQQESRHCLGYTPFKGSRALMCLPSGTETVNQSNQIKETVLLTMSSFFPVYLVFDLRFILHVQKKFKYLKFVFQSCGKISPFTIKSAASE